MKNVAGLLHNANFVSHSTFMNLYGKILYYTALCYILIWIVAFFAWPFLPFEFSNEVYREHCIAIFAFSFPVAIAFTFVKDEGKMDSRFNCRVFLKVGLAFITLLIAVIIWIFSGFSSSVIDKIVFENKYNPAKQIVVRHIDNGAFDSGDDDYKVVYMYRLSKAFNYVTNIDTLQINRGEWIRGRQRVDK